MKYAIDGNMNSIIDGSPVVAIINKYFLYRLEQAQDLDPYPATTGTFGFTAWVNTLSDKDSLFNELHQYATTNSLTGFLEWHECHHDEPGNTLECIIAQRIEF